MVGLVKRTYGELISQVATLNRRVVGFRVVGSNSRVVEETWAGFKPFYREAVEPADLRV